MTYKLKGFEGDLKYWKQWMDSLGSYRLDGIYTHDETVNYPPVFLTMLWVYRFFVQSSSMFALKLPVVLMELLALGGIVLLLKKYGWTDSRHKKLILYLLFSPVVLYITSVWGQVDFFHSALMAMSLLSLLASPAVAGVLFGLALLTKLQAVVIAPVFGLVLLRRLLASDWRRPMRFAAGFAVPWLLFTLYFAAYHTFPAFIRHSYLDAVGYYPNVSLYAANIWFNLIGVAPDTPDTEHLVSFLTYRDFGLLLFAIAALFVLGYLASFRQLQVVHLLKAGFLLSFSFYMLPTEIHDRYVIPAVILAACIAFLERKRIWFYLLLAMELDTVVTLTIFLKKSKYPALEHLGTPAAAVFLVLFVLTIAIACREMVQARRLEAGEKPGKTKKAA